MRITVIGSGNVATHLAAAFKNAGHRITQVYSRNLQHAALLAYHVGAEAVDQLDSIHAETDLLLIAVKDDAITDVAEQVKNLNIPIVHTSGAVSLTDLSVVVCSAGVFYPLQTFSKSRETDFRQVPVCIEADTPALAETLTQLAQTVSNHVYQVSSEQRKMLHLSAVFACNFPNYLYHVAQQLMAQQGLNFDMLRPLIAETAAKVQNSLPAQVQTGPAIRQDEGTMAAHLQLLHEQPQLQQLYKLLSQGIIKMK